MKAGILTTGAVIAALSTVASAAYISNGDFETAGTSGADFDLWVESGVNPASAINPGITGQSVLLSATATASALTQNVTGNLSRAAVEMDLALSTATASARTFNVFVRHTASTDQINLRVTDNDSNGVGDISVFLGGNTGSWVTILTNAVTFSSAQNDLKVNHLKIEVDYTTGTYNVYVTNAAGQLAQALGNNQFQITTTAVTSSSTLKGIVFSTANWATNSWAVVDNVAVSDPAAIPEPAAVSMLALGGGILLGRKRRSK